MSKKLILARLNGKRCLVCNVKITLDNSTINKINKSDYTCSACELSQKRERRQKLKIATIKNMVVSVFVVAKRMLYSYQ